MCCDSDEIGQGPIWNDDLYDSHVRNSSLDISEGLGRCLDSSLDLECEAAGLPWPECPEWEDDEDEGDPDASPAPDDGPEDEDLEDDEDGGSGGGSSASAADASFGVGPVAAIGVGAVFLGCVACAGAGTLFARRRRDARHKAGGGGGGAIQPSPLDPFAPSAQGVCVPTVVVVGSPTGAGSGSMPGGVLKGEALKGGEAALSSKLQQMRDENEALKQRLAARKEEQERGGAAPAAEDEWQTIDLSERDATATRLRNIERLDGWARERERRVRAKPHATGGRDGAARDPGGGPGSGRGRMAIGSLLTQQC